MTEVDILMLAFRKILTALLFLILISSIFFSILVVAQEPDSWKRTEVDSLGNVGDFNSIAIGPKDVVHISYYDSGKQQLKYATDAGGSWKDYVVDSGSGKNSTGQHSCLAVDSKNQVHIAYTSVSNGSTCLKYATGSAGNWKSSFVDYLNVSGRWVPRPLNPDATLGIALDSSSQAYISCQDVSGKLGLATNAGGTWSNFTLIGASDEARGGDFNSIALDRENNIFIAYHATVSAKNKSISSLNTIDNLLGKWTNATVDDSGDAGSYNSIKVSNSGIQIAYRDEAPGSLKYAFGSGNKWTIQTVASGNTGYFASLAVDSSPQIICENKSDLSLDYFSLSEDKWNGERVWNHGNATARCSLAINSTGEPQIAMQNPEDLNLVYIIREAGTTPQGQVPSEPRNLRAAVEDQSINLTWDPPSSEGSGGITGYHVYKNGTLVANLTETKYRDTNVSVGSSKYNVSAVNTAGEGANASITVKVSENHSAPSAPLDLKANAGDTKVDLTWKPPKNNGSAPITNYRVYRNSSFLGSINSTNYTDTHVKNGVKYAYYVTAVNSAGEGNESNSVSATPESSIRLPGIPHNLTAETGNKSINLTWEAPLDDGKSPIIDYRIYIDGDYLGHTGNGSARYFNDTGLVNGQKYEYGVSAVNKAGEGDNATVNATPSTVPDAPVLKNAAPGNAQVVLNWSAPEDTGGSKVTGYRIIWKTAGGTERIIEVGNELQYTQAGLDPGTIYYYQVVAVNEKGASGRSAQVSATTWDVPPSPALTLIWRNGGVELKWTTPQSVPPIDFYLVYRNGEEIANTTAKTYFDVNLSMGTEYQYLVRAHDVVGLSPPSNVQIIVSPQLPSAPVLHATEGSGYCLLNWTLSYDGGSPIANYTIFRGTESGNRTELATIGNVTYYNDTSVTNEVIYFYSVAAANNVGNGPNSTEVNATPYSLEPLRCRIEANITSGKVGTDFNFAVILESNRNVEVRWDFENDGVYDTDWSNNLDVTHSYNKTGSFTVKCEVMDMHNVTGSATTIVKVGTTSSGINSTPLVMIGIVSLLAVIAIVGLYLIRKRGI